MYIKDEGPEMSEMLKAFYGTMARQELLDFIVENGFASRVKRMLGAELNSTLEMLAEEDEDQWGIDSVHDLYCLLKSGWSLDHEWFMWTDGIYRDDNHQFIPDSLPRTYTASEQMAAYGLHLLSVEMDCMGHAPEVGENDQGWTRGGVLYHEAACLIRANQAITYAVRLQGSSSSATVDEAIRKKFSELGSHRAEKRIAMYQKAKDFVTSEWAQHRSAYNNNKSDFARAYVRLIPQQFTKADGKTPLLIAERTIKDDWLP